MHSLITDKASSSCVRNQKSKGIVRSLETCWESTHELLHLHQHRSSHGHHLVDDRGGTRWWCDLLSAGLLRSCRLDSRIGPISTYQHWSALLQCVAYWVWPSLVLEGSEPRQHLDGETIDRLSKNPGARGREGNTKTFRLKCIVIAL